MFSKEKLQKAKERLRKEGQTIGGWAKANGFGRNEVSRVLNGQSKAYYGKAHAIAVKLGLKNPAKAAA